MAHRQHLIQQSKQPNGGDIEDSPTYEETREYWLNHMQEKERERNQVKGDKEKASESEDCPRNNTTQTLSQFLSRHESEDCPRKNIKQTLSKFLSRPEWKLALGVVSASVGIGVGIGVGCAIAKQLDVASASVGVCLGFAIAKNYHQSDNIELSNKENPERINNEM